MIHPYWFQNCLGTALLCKREGCDWITKQQNIGYSLSQSWYGKYLFLFRCGHKLLDNGHIVLNKQSKIQGCNVGIFIAIQTGEYELIRPG